MRTTISFVAALSLLALAANAQESKSAGAKKDSPRRIAAADAQKHLEETVIVTGKVAQVTIREKLVYVNLDKPFPDSPFTAVVFARATNQFGDLKQLNGKQVEINGKITEYRNRPQIILDNTNQLKVVDTVVESGGTGKK